jgi:D-alanyl-D-alanine dipeptidase
MMNPDIALIDVASILPQVCIDLKYASTDNFTGQVIYRENRCLLHPDAAKAFERSVQVARLAGFTLKVFDAYRPQQAQAFLWQVLPDPRYVADVKIGSNHSRGVAVDVTLMTDDGAELDMGTGFDDADERSHHYFPDLPVQIQRNRLLLHAIMHAGGFGTIPTEWWHFELPDALSYVLLTDRFDCFSPQHPVV